ncbi:MAG: alpha/beta hydrolase [Terriglobales bacterium]
MHKTGLKRAGRILIGYAVFCLIAGVVVSDLSLHLHRRPLPEPLRATAVRISSSLGASLQPVEITAQDGIPLRAWTVVPTNGNGNTVLLLHGVTDNRLGMAGYAQFFVRYGYTVLMPDSRAHGESGGRIATYGLRESSDIHLWVDWIEEHQHPGCVFGMGESMGAGLILESLHTEHRFCAVIAESPFANTRDVESERLANFVGLPPWFGHTVLRPVVWSGFLYSRLRYGINLDNASPSNAVEGVTTPIFLIHGTEDRNILPWHSREIQKHNRNIVLWEVPGAAHTGAWNAQPEEFELRVLEWFQTHQRTISNVSGS